MSDVLLHQYPIASKNVVRKLVELGYLPAGRRLNNRAVRGALAKLQNQLLQSHTICIQPRMTKPPLAGTTEHCPPALE